MPKTSQIPISALVDDTRARLITVLRQHGVRRAGVFGSFVRGEQTPTSDVDLLIERDAKATLFTLARLEMALEDIVGRPVDLITFNALESSSRPRLRERILHDLILLQVD
ncbi:MAG TPA: nucleotidyltransferase family protein [Ktedonobacterales bacterium]|nr:nucleotidyltransferase family protein [Ktedonobacterales bacterium]